MNHSQNKQKSAKSDKKVGCIIMDHRLYVRNNIQAVRSVDELERAFLLACRDSLSPTNLHSVLKQLRQELTTLATDDATGSVRQLRDRVCAFQLVLCSKSKDFAEILVLLNGLQDLDRRCSVELLVLALMVDDEKREMEMACLLARTDTGPLFDRIAPAVVSFVAGDGWLAFSAPCNVQEDESVGILMTHLREAACERLNARHQKAFRGQHRVFSVA